MKKRDRMLRLKLAPLVDASIKKVQALSPILAQVNEQKGTKPLAKANISLKLKRRVTQVVMNDSAMKTVIQKTLTVIFIFPI